LGGKKNSKNILNDDKNQTSKGESLPCSQNKVKIPEAKVG